MDEQTKKEGGELARSRFYMFIYIFKSKGWVMYMEWNSIGSKQK